MDSDENVRTIIKIDCPLLSEMAQHIYVMHVSDKSSHNWNTALHQLAAHRGEVTGRAQGGGGAVAPPAILTRSCVLQDVVHSLQVASPQISQKTPYIDFYRGK